MANSNVKSAEENTKMDVEIELKNLPAWPPGYYFVPTPVIIFEYLVKRIMGVRLPSDMIKVRDGVQLLDPQQHRFEDEFAHCSDNQAYYISNKAERKADGGGGSKPSTIIKTTSGYWREKKKDIAIYNKDGQIIGYKTRYMFCCANNDDTSWRMDEFTVNPETIPADARDQIKQTIACRIRVKRPKEPEGPYCEDEELEEEYEVDENED
ncbi:hypothetical protein POM88_013537 [Heracleum sosnowskyi]|uniref:NAC domain-containing protein n=1 Tax=Heracleum sosnowskyi TaxID=360622 RepID=A0AAD8J190_9APIA|nr:hypothetical protein POM88_013537 [Heracleum sosnowskyi]